ncbi:MAG: hypothetical protein LUG99_07000 [Lachnospiraceae bacterium]|nr:hypothetical protein [Lachnospiraceae bacterium]
MDRENIQYTEEPEQCPWGTIVFFRTDISEEKHHELVVDALCELQRADSGDGLPVYSSATLSDKEKLDRLMEINGTEEYNLLSCDHWKQMFAERPEEEMLVEEKRDEYGGSSEDFGWVYRDYEKAFDGDFTTSDEMFPHLKAVLDRENIEYKIEDKIVNGEERKFFVTGISEEQHLEFVEDAVCEYQRERDHVRVPVYSYKMLTNPEILRRLMKINGTDKYEVLIKDRKRWKEYQKSLLPEN